MIKNRKKDKYLKQKRDSFVNKKQYVHFHDTELLTKFITYSGSIKPRKVTGASARHQRMIARAIKRARQMAFLPYSSPKVRRRPLANKEKRA